MKVIDASVFGQVMPSLLVDVAPSPRFVDVAHEFLVTPHHCLREHFTTRVPLSREHHADTPKERVLGLTDVGVYRRHGP